MGFAFNKNYYKPRITLLEEGLLRESLAAYFLSAPPADKQNSQQQEKYKRALRTLAQLDTLSVLQYSLIKPTLRYGDLNKLIFVTLKASSMILKKQGIKVDIDINQEAIYTAAESRLIQITLVRLMYAASKNCTSFDVCVKIKQNSIIICIYGAKILDKQALNLTNIAARIHKGGIAISNRALAFSIKLGLQSSEGFFETPLLQELLEDSLSIINTGLA